MSKDSFNKILLDNDPLVDNSNFPLNVSLSIPTQILNKSNDGVCNSFKENDSHAEKIESYIKEKFKEVALNHLKNQTIKELTLEMSNKSIETKSDLIKSLISSKSAEKPVTIQISTDTVHPKNPLKEKKRKMQIRIE